MATRSKSPGDSSAALGFEAKLWLADDMASLVFANGSMSSNKSGEVHSSSTFPTKTLNPSLPVTA